MQAILDGCSKICLISYFLSKFLSLKNPLVIRAIFIRAQGAFVKFRFHNSFTALYQFAVKISQRLPFLQRGLMKKSESSSSNMTSGS